MEKRPRGRPRKTAVVDAPVKHAIRGKRGVTQPGALTIAELAKGVGVSTTTIEKYTKRGCPRHSVEAVMKWRSENIAAVAEDADPSEIMMELKRAEVKERNENARTRQLKNDVLEGRLIRKDHVEREISIAVGRLLNRLNAIATEAALLCPDELKVPIKAKVENVVLVAIKEVRDQLGELS